MSAAPADPLVLAGKTLTSRLFLGSALYPNPEVMVAAIRASGAEVVTVSLRRQNPTAKGGQRFWELIRSLHVQVLPNTAGCHTAKEAVTTAQMAREFASVERVGTIPGRHAMPYERDLPIHLCRGLRVPLAGAWRGARFYI